MTLQPTRLRRLLPVLGVLVAAAGLSGCYNQEPTQAVAAPTAAAPPDVSIVVVKPLPMTLTRELPGRIAPMRIAEVRPRVGGIIVQRTFEQGSMVKAGDVLYRIDPAPFEAELESAKAQVAKAEAVQFQTSRQAERLKQLVSRQAASEAQAEAAIATDRQAAADIALARAALRRAQLNLDYATVRAPITGRIGRALVTEGALVQSETSHLATIQQLDPIYADFTQSVAELNQLRQDLAKGVLTGLDPGTASVRLMVDDDTPYSRAGRLLFSDVTVDPTTAQVTLRGEFPNPEKFLLPGMYVRVLIEQGVDVDALTVPAQALQRNNAGGSEVYVINDEGRAVIQPVRTGRFVGDRWVIEDGLKSGDRVVVEGFQKITPGALVKATDWAPPDVDLPSTPASPVRPASAQSPQQIQAR